MATGLVIIDVQNGFKQPSYKRIVPNIKKQIRKAKRYGWHIIFVEYRLCGLTILELRREAEGHDLIHFVKKEDDDGHRGVRRKVEREGIKRLKITGVNSDCCVKSTTKSLSKKMPHLKIEVIKDCCGREIPLQNTEGTGGLWWVSKLKNAELV